MTDDGEHTAALGRTWPVRLKAALAGGLVLGAGATTTLAAWTDETVVQAELAASVFTVEANASSPFDPAGAWAPRAGEDDSAVLQLDADGLTPGSARYAPLALRTAPGSLGGTAVLQSGTVESSGPGDADLGGALRYRVVESTTCGADAFTAGADFLVGGPSTSQALTAGQDGDAPFTLPAAAPDASGDPVHLCFELTLPSEASSQNALQGQTATAEWDIISTSEST